VLVSGNNKETRAHWSSKRKVALSFWRVTSEGMGLGVSGRLACSGFLLMSSWTKGKSQGCPFTIGRNSVDSGRWHRSKENITEPGEFLLKSAFYLKVVLDFQKSCRYYQISRVPIYRTPFFLLLRSYISVR
jgi:hypothetical protein